MKSKLRLLALAAVAVLGLAGCGGGGGSGGVPGGGGDQTAQLTVPPESPVVSSLERDTDPQVDEADLQAAVAGNNALAFDLLRASEGNVVLGPTVLTSGLARLYAGAGGATTGELAGSADFFLPSDRLFPALNALDLDLSERLGPVGFASSAGEVAQSGYLYRLSYLEELARNSGAKPESGGLTSFGDDTRLALSDHISLAASWSAPFDPAQVRQETFTLEDGASISAPMLDLHGTYPSAQADDYFAVELPFASSELSILFVAPKEGTLAAFDASWNEARLDEIAAALLPTELALSVPTFTVDETVPAEEVLRGRGVSGAVSPGSADFSGIDGTRDLYVSGLAASSCFSLSQGGARAVALFSSALDDAHPETGSNPVSPGANVVTSVTLATPDPPGTGVLAVGTAAPGSSAALARPFFFAVRDGRTRVLLFLGRLVDPRGTPVAALTSEITGFFRIKYCDGE
ncbi:MAG: hypothetical protein HY900_30770 [Deltaproteobacteria bacterium]|nr:hypothetical protein [Deltaproteobacteria bacterium]